MSGPPMPKKASPKKKPTKVEAVELVPDAWPRFERLIKQAAKIGPQPRVAKKPKTGGASKKRVRKNKH